MDAKFTVTSIVEGENSSIALIIFRRLVVDWLLQMIDVDVVALKTDRHGLRVRIDMEVVLERLRFLEVDDRGTGMNVINCSKGLRESQWSAKKIYFILLVECGNRRRRG